MAWHECSHSPHCKGNPPMLELLLKSTFSDVKFHQESKSCLKMHENRPPWEIWGIFDVYTKKLASKCIKSPCFLGCCYYGFILSQEMVVIFVQLSCVNFTTTCFLGIMKCCWQFFSFTHWYLVGDFKLKFCCSKPDFLAQIRTAK